MKGYSADAREPVRVRANVRSFGTGENIIRTIRSLASSGGYRLRLITAAARCLPDFVIIGAQRSGSSTLFKHVASHPQVLPPPQKELHFFDLGYAKGDWFYRSRFPLRAARNRAGSNGANALTGEATPYYLSHPLVAERVAAMLPGCRLIAVLRNPIDRAFSDYTRNVNHGYERYSFEQAIDLEESRIDPEVDRMLVDSHYYSWKHRRFTYLSRGYYARHLERWFELFPRSSFLILKSEEMFADPNKVLSEVWDFLKLEPYSIQEDVRELPNTYAERLSGETRARLSAHFRPHNERLYELIGRNFEW